MCKHPAHSSPNNRDPYSGHFCFLTEGIHVVDRPSNINIVREHAVTQIQAATSRTDSCFRK